MAEISIEQLNHLEELSELDDEDRFALIPSTKVTVEQALQSLNKYRECLQLCKPKTVQRE